MGTDSAAGALYVARLVLVLSHRADASSVSAGEISLNVEGALLDCHRVDPVFEESGHQTPPPHRGRGVVPSALRHMGCSQEQRRQSSRRRAG